MLRHMCWRTRLLWLAAPRQPGGFKMAKSYCAQVAILSALPALSPPPPTRLLRAAVPGTLRRHKALLPHHLRVAASFRHPGAAAAGA